MIERIVRVGFAARCLLILLGIGLLSPTAVIALRAPGQLVTQHNKQIAAWPKNRLLLDNPQAFFEQVEAWHGDHIGLGVRAGKLYRQVSYYVLGDGAVINVDRGSGNMVFLSSHQPDGSFRSIDHSCPKREDWAAKAASASEDWSIITSVFRSRGLDATLLIIPSKKVLYGERLPKSVPLNLRLRCLQMQGRDNPIAMLAMAHKETVVNAEPALSPFKDRPHFYPPQNFHADGESAARSVQALLSRLYPDQVWSEEIGPFAPRPGYADLVGVLGFRRAIPLSEPIAFTKPSFHPDLNYLRPLQARLGVKLHANRFTTPAADIKEDILLIANSFGARTAPYVSRYVASVREVNTNQLRGDDLVRFFEEYVFEEPPDRVVFVLHDESVFRERLGKYAAALSSVQE